MYTKTLEAGFGSAVIIGLIAVVLLGGGAYYVSMDTEPDPALMVSEDSVEMLDEKKMHDDMMEDKEASDTSLEGYLTVDADAEIDTTYLPSSEPGEYIAYSGDYSYAQTGDLVLFFHASWCPSCRGLDEDITANLEDIPDGVSIQKVDYDTATDLKKKYGVVRQHTLVQVDENGAALQTLTGLTNTLDQVLGQL